MLVMFLLISACKEDLKSTDDKSQARAKKDVDSGSDSTPVI